MVEQAVQAAAPCPRDLVIGVGQFLHVELARVSNDAQSYALRRHLLLRTRSVVDLVPRSVSQADGLLQVAQPVAAALDVEDVAVMEQPVEDGGGQHLVAGQQLGPVLDALVGGDEDGASSVAVADEPEEQRGGLPVHGLEAHLVDDEQRHVEVLAPAQPGGRELGIALEGGDELLDAQEQHREAVLHSLDAQGDGQMCFPHTRGSLDEEGLAGAQPGAGGQGLDARALDGGLEGEVEVAERLAGGQAGELERGADAPLLAFGELVGQQAIQEGVRGQLLAVGLGQPLGQVLCGVHEACAPKLLGGGIEIHPGARPGAHRATSASAAYRSRGRCSGARAAICCSLAPMRPSGGGAWTSGVEAPS